MSLLMKAAVAAVTGAILSLLLKRSAPELSLAVTSAVTLMGAALAVQLVGGLTEVLTIVREETGLSPAVVGPVLKCVGVGIVTRLSADLCKDAGQTAAASAVELCGAACAMVTALPLIRALLKMMSELV